MTKQQEKEIRVHLETLDKDQIIELYLQKCFDIDVQLAEKDKKISELKQTIIKKFMNMKFTDFIKLGLEDGFVVKAMSTGNLKAIEELGKVKEFIIRYSELKGQAYNHTLNFINTRIKQLKGE